MKTFLSLKLALFVFLLSPGYFATASNGWPMSDSTKNNLATELNCHFQQTPANDWLSHITMLQPAIMTNCSREMTSYKESVAVYQQIADSTCNNFFQQHQGVELISLLELHKQWQNNIKQYEEQKYLAELEAQKPTFFLPPPIVANEMEEREFSYAEIDLSSLLNDWYRESHIPAFDQHPIMPDSIDSDIPDSVYIARINAMPTIMNLGYNEKTRHYVEMYTLGYKSFLEKLIGKFQYYEPIIENIFLQHDIPLELKYVCIIESGINPNAESWAHAVGLWQFLKGTGQIYGLEVNRVVDQRRDPIAATHAAALYLKTLYARYGDWSLALAAYNCGPGNVDRAIRKNDGKKDYWEVCQSLPRETQKYVPAFIGAAYMMNYYEEAGLTPKPYTALPPASDTIMIKGYELHFSQVSQVLQVPEETLQALNPQYRRSVIPAKDHAYPLRLPMDYVANFIYLEPVIRNTTPLNDKQTLAENETSDSQAIGLTPSNKLLQYTFKQGDKLDWIAQWYNVSLQQLKSWNNLTNNRLPGVGETLKVFVPAHRYKRYETINTMTLKQKSDLSARHEQENQPVGEEQGYLPE